MNLHPIVYLSVFKSSTNGRISDCTGGGVSGGSVETLALFPKDVSTDTEDPAGCPAVKVSINGFGDPILVPVATKPEGALGPMFGGNYAGTSDSRLSEEITRITGRRFYGAVPIHDRFETSAQYAANSR